ncbi:MAG: hypothetical protein H7318_00295 [Oligoflexus sp.]|nr:hypothetical protein [Oligoflexus sp.]
MACAGAKPKKQCGLCGGTKKLKACDCCEQWICNDESQYQMFRNSCSRNHRRYILCGHHHAERHDGEWQNCSKCRENIETEMYVYYGTNEYNFEKLINPPTFEATRCSNCKSVIKLGDDPYSVTSDGHYCERCAEQLLSSRSL